MASVITNDGEKVIPIDLINEILIRLPVKSVIRCSSVCKPWFSLISNPNFTKSHLKHAIAKSRADLTIIGQETGNYSMSLLNLNSRKTCGKKKNKTRKTEPPISIGVPFSKFDYCMYRSYLIVGSYNGIVCVNGSEHMSSYPTNPNIYLWNPATKQSKLLPPPKIRGNVKSAEMGFGFDPIGNDFKVVRFVMFNHKLISDEPCYAAEIYSANSNDWREVNPSPTDHCKYDKLNVCLNGFLCCPGSRPMSMIAFDLDKEVFTFGINLPAISSNYCITDFNDSIAFVTIMEDKSNRAIQLWTLDNEACLRGGVEASWTVILTVDVDFPNPRVIVCFNSGDFLLYSVRDGYLLWNSHKKEFRNVPDSVRIANRIIRYHESFVSITGSQQVLSPVDAHEDNS